MRLFTTTALASLAVLTPALPAFAADASFRDLGLTTGQNHAYGYGVSADGTIATGSLTGTAKPHSYRWSASSGMTEIGMLPGGDSTIARAISPDGRFITGLASDAAGIDRAFRWSEATGAMSSLGTLNGGGRSDGYGISRDGKFVSGQAIDGITGLWTAFRWSEASGVMSSLGPLNGGRNSYGYGISDDGKTVVGVASDGGSSNQFRAFRWTEASGRMSSLGVLNAGDTESLAFGVSADGSVVVGSSGIDANQRGFRWTAATGMTSIGTLGGKTLARAVSGDGRVVVGYSLDANNRQVAVRWSADNNQLISISRWLTDAGVSMGSINPIAANAANSDGSVIVGTLWNQQAFLARVVVSSNSIGTSTGSNTTTQPDADEGDSSNLGTNASSAGRSATGSPNSGASGSSGSSSSSGTATGTGSGSGSSGASGSSTVPPSPAANAAAPVSTVTTGGSGMIVLDDFNSSLWQVPGARFGLRIGELTMNGGHGRPMRALIEAGASDVWAAGDLGWLKGDLGSGAQGFGEAGYGYGVSEALTARLALGGFRQTYRPDTGGNTVSRLAYLMPELSLNPAGALYLTGSLFHGRGESLSHRGYINGDQLDFSDGSAALSVTGLRLRADLKDIWDVSGTTVSPFASYTLIHSHRDGFVESGGSFPVSWDSHSETSRVIRAGLDATRPLTPDVLLLGHLEANYGFESETSAATGTIIGLSAFSTGQEMLQHFGLQAGLGVEVAMGGGTASLMGNLASGGNNPSAWLAASYRVRF